MQEAEEAAGHHRGIIWGRTAEERGHLSHLQGKEDPSEGRRYLWEGVNDRGKLIELGYGSVEKYGDDLPNGRNYKEYLDEKGRFDNIKEISRRVVEVGFERFFGLSGYVSQPRRNKLEVRNYERIAILPHMLQHIYIDPEGVAAEYRRRSKAKAWKTQIADESLSLLLSLKSLLCQSFTLPNQTSHKQTG
eukprot:scaffold14401_cov58-Cyclotella_meneghiniana.AAC.24